MAKMTCATYRGPEISVLVLQTTIPPKRTLDPWGKASIITRFLNVFSSENIVIINNVLQFIRNGCNRPAQKIMAQIRISIISKGSTDSMWIAIRQNQSLHGGTCLPFSHANIIMSLIITAHWHTCKTMSVSHLPTTNSVRFYNAQ